MKKRCVLLLMTAMLITLGGCSKETENKMAPDKAVESEQSTEAEEKPDEIEEEETITLQSVTGSELSSMMEDVAHILGRNCVNWYEEIVTPQMVKRAADDTEELNFVNMDRGNWNFEEVIKDMRLQLLNEGDVDSFNVSTNCVATNFNEPYRYVPEDAETLYTLTKIRFAAKDTTYETESVKNIFVTVQYTLYRDEWCIEDIKYVDKSDLDDMMRRCGYTDYSECAGILFNYEPESIVYDTNIKPLIEKLDTSDMDSYLALFNQLYENEVNNKMISSESNTIKCSIEYIDGDDIPEMILWWYSKDDEDFCWQSKIYYYSGRCLHVRTFNVANGDTNNVTYTPKHADSSEHILVKSVDNETEIRWEEYQFYADTVYAKKNSYIKHYEPTETEYKYAIKGEFANSAEEVQDYISSLGFNTTFTIYDSVDEAFGNLK